MALITVHALIKHIHLESFRVHRILFTSSVIDAFTTLGVDAQRYLQVQKKVTSN